VTDESRKPQSGGLSIKTLLIAGAASATAAYVVPLFWKPGTVFAAAMTPVIVTVVSELLNRPADTVSKVASRRTSGGAVVFEPPPPPRADEPFDPLAPAPTEELEALQETTTRRAVHRRGLTGRQWRVALITAAIAFAGAVLFVTASELVAGETPGSSNNPTTFFGGSKKRDKDPTPTPTATPSEEERERATPTPTPTPTSTPTATPTPTPGATVTPAPQQPLEQPPASPTPTP
jgi:hypothetical protein